MPISSFSPAPRDRAAVDVLQEQSRLIDSTAPIRRMLNAAPVAAMLLNRQRQIVAVNERLLEFVGATTVDEVLGLRPGELLECRNAAEAEDGCATSESCGLCGSLRAILGSQTGRANTQVYRIRRRTSTAEECVNLETSAAPLEIGDQEFTLVFASDRGDRIRREFLEYSLLPEALARAAEIEALAGGLARANAPEQRERTAAALAATAARLASTLRSYGEIAAAEAGELRIAPRGISALGALREAAAGFEFVEAARARQLSIDRGAEDAEVSTDPAQLRRILHGLVLNALEASPTQSAVTLGCRPAGERAEFWVHNGGELPRAVQLQMFQRGFSTKGPGRGFGTYVMKLIAERFLGGSVCFRSNRQEGTTFVLSLPLAGGAAAEAAE